MLASGNIFPLMHFPNIFPLDLVFLMDGKTLFMFSTFGNGIFQKTKYLKKLFSFFGFLQKSYHCNTSCINLVFAKMLHFYKLSTVFVLLKSSNVHFRFHPVHVDDYPVHFLDYPVHFLDYSQQNISQQNFKETKLYIFE